MGSDMGFFRKLGDSAELAGGMAERMGIDLPARILADPDHEAARYRTMVLRCSGCEGQASCRLVQRACVDVPSPPGYCRNRTMFMDMAS